VQGPAAAHRRLRAPDFDPTREVVVEGRPPAPAERPQRPLGLTIRVDDAERVIVEVGSPAQAGEVLVLADGFAAGWSARAGGEELPVLPADLALRAVPLPVGFQGTVEFRYRAPGASAGWGVTCAILLLGCALLGWARRGAHR
jgi:hypothetical protein